MRPGRGGRAGCGGRGRSGGCNGRRRWRWGRAGGRRIGRCRHAWGLKLGCGGLSLGAWRAPLAQGGLPGPGFGLGAWAELNGIDQALGVAPRRPSPNHSRPCHAAMPCRARASRAAGAGRVEPPARRACLAPPRMPLPGLPCGDNGRPCRGAGRAGRVAAKPGPCRAGAGRLRTGGLPPSVARHHQGAASPSSGRGAAGKKHSWRMSRPFKAQ